MTPREILSQAVDEAGSQTKLARLIGCTQNAVWQALKRGVISPLMARRLDEWSRGRYSKHDLRPDIFGARPQPAVAA